MTLKPLLILPPIALAVAGFLWINQQEPAALAPKPEARLAVRAMTVAEKPVTASAIGYGRVEAVHEWTAVAEVQGRVTRIPTDLAVGSIVEPGSTLFEIDVTDYELARDKARANIASAEAQLAELDRQEENTRASLAVEERIFAVAQAEHDRVKALFAKGTATQSQSDAAQKSLLLQTNALTNLKNTLALYPAKRQSLEASLNVRKADLADAERAIGKTRITAPFKARVSMLSVELGQFVRMGDKVLVLQDISAAEITAELQPSAFAPMIMLALRDQMIPGAIVDTSKAVSILNAAGITAEVSAAQAGLNARWPAEIMRMRGTMDSETGSLGLVVRVRDPLLGNRPTAQPPLNVGMFVAVTLATQPVAGVLAIPRPAIRYGDGGTPFVYVADDAGRLARADLTLGTVVGDEVIVEDGLVPGDRLVLSNPQPPVLGMALDILIDAGDR